MSIVTISSRYQVVIPKDVREKLDLRPGQKVMAIPYRGRVELVPVQTLASAEGSIPGLDASVLRDEDRT